MRSYIEDTKTEGEEIIGEGRFSWLCMALAMAPFWIGLILVYVALQLVAHSALLADKIPAQVLDYGFIAILVVGIFQYLMKALPWVYLEIVATTHRIVYSRGFFTRRTVEVAINRLQGVNLRQTFLGRIFNFGSLTIFGIGVDEIVLPPIANPVEFRRSVQEAVTASQNSHDASFL